MNESSARVPLGVFPPRKEAKVGAQHIYSPLALNAYVSPRMGPAQRGTTVRLSLLNLARDLGCIQRLLNLQCLFGSGTSSRPAVFEAETRTLVCISPPGPTLISVPLLLLESNSTVISSSKLF